MGERELAMDHPNADVNDVIRAKMLVTAKFLERVSSSLQTQVSAPCNINRCYSTTTVEINTAAKPSLKYGIARLTENMLSLFATQSTVGQAEDGSSSGTPSS